MVSSSSAFDDHDDDDDVSLLLSKSVSSSSSPSSFFFESATKRILFRRPRCVRPRSKRVLVARVERRTKLFEKVEDDDDDEENHGAERTAPPPTRTVKEDVMFPREHYTTLCRLCIVKVFPTIDAEVSRSVFSQSARVSRFNSSAERRGRPFPQRYDVANNANEEQHQRRHHQRRRRIRISTQRK